MAFDSSGNLFVANAGNNTVSEFIAVGGILPTSPTVTRTGLDYPSAMAFDSSGNLYVANDTASGTVSEFTNVGGSDPPHPRSPSPD